MVKLNTRLFYTQRKFNLLHEETEGYAGDWLGLKTMDANGMIDYHSYEGDHLRWSNEFWDETVLPYLGDTFDAL